MSVMQLEKKGHVAVITMTNGENRFNPEFVDTLHNLLDEIEADNNMHSVVLASNSGKYWTLGLDLNWVLTVGADPKQHDDLKAFLFKVNDLFKRFLTFPMPIIAAMGGHVFGNGAILACVCDFRFMRGGKGYFCFPEVEVNIPFLPGMVQIIKSVFPDYLHYEMILTGKRVDAAELNANNVVMKACENDEELLESAIAFAQTFNKNRPIFSELKTRFNQHILDAIDNKDPKYINSLQLTAG